MTHDDSSIKSFDWNETDRTCDRCRWWEQSDYKDIGYCHRMPPALFAMPGQYNKDAGCVISMLWACTRYPVTADYDACGEWTEGSDHPTETD